MQDNPFAKYAQPGSTYIPPNPNSPATQERAFDNLVVSRAPVGCVPDQGVNPP